MRVARHCGKAHTLFKTEREANPRLIVKAIEPR